MAQPNCKAFKYYGDTLKYKACIKSEEMNQYYQFDREFQEILDEALAIDTTFAYAYREKSVAYLKSGDFITWKKLIDQAVHYNKKDNLGYRAWCRYQFFHDYKGAIADIEALEKLIGDDTGYAANGDYHLSFARAFCYKALGDRPKALEIMETTLANPLYSPLIYDYFHLGVTYYETKNYAKALEAFEKQRQENDIADNRYYIALVFKHFNKKLMYEAHLKKARMFYVNGQRLQDPYTHPIDKIYLKDIDSEINVSKGIMKQEYMVHF